VRRTLIRAASGEEPADAVFSDLLLFNPFSCEWEETSFAVKDGIVVGIGDYQGRAEHDLHGARVIPGLIDSHVHIESSLLVPSEYARLVLAHGTTTVIADPHEIANVCGATGISYMLNESARTDLDILFLLPSCVPATPADQGGAVLDADDLARFIGKPGVIGLAEVMNVPGVLSGDPGVFAKLAISRIIDGHAPHLVGKPLNAYILSGIQSDHESTTADEAMEKLRRGMYIFLREGSTERNLRDLAPIISRCTAPRCSFATDDRSVDTLIRDGHIDDCVRKAVSYGVELETVLRMATLSPCDRFLLSDRGAIAPGRYADFCVIADGKEFSIVQTYKRGKAVGGSEYQRSDCLRHAFNVSLPESPAFTIRGAGEARVIGLVKGGIVTLDLRYSLDASEIPDLERDILKVVVCDRYLNRGCGVGLVHGFGLAEGALASSVSHDAHNIVAVGTSDAAICTAQREVIAMGGGMVATGETGTIGLPLECAGLMSALPYPRVAERLDAVHRQVKELGGIDHAFMYLSFLSLTVIPHLRITNRGLFDVAAWADVPVFCPTGTGPEGEMN
jgi:adenine deaminase